MNIITQEFFLSLFLDQILIKLKKSTSPITKYGNFKLEELIKLQIHNHKILNERQIILNKILNNKTLTENIKILLHKINDFDKKNPIIWFFYNVDTIKINDNIKKNNDNIKFIKFIPLGFSIYYIYQTFFNNNKNDINKKNMILYICIFIIVFFIIYKFNHFSSKKNDKDINNENKINEYSNNFKELKEIIKIIYELSISNDFSDADNNIVLDNMKILYTDFNINFSIDSFNKLLNNKKKYEEYFTYVLQYVGLIDAYIFIAELTLQNYCLPIFENSEKPYVYIEKLFNPLINNYISNDFYLGSPNTMIITGPNFSGKSTYLYNVLLSVFLAQSLGISCCNKIILTPFKIIYYNFILSLTKNPNESLFRTSMNQCYNYYNILSTLDSNSFMFGIMDELIVGSTISVEIQNSLKFCEILLKYPNNLLCIATHKYSLTELVKKYPDNIINKKFTVKKKKDGQPYYSYKIKTGIYNIS